MTKKERIEEIIALYQSGCLCDCTEYDEILDEDRNIIDVELRHKINCVGRLKAQALVTDDVYWEDHEKRYA